jgi:hypothetical protein
MSSKKWLLVASIAAITGVVAWKERQAVADTLERWTHYHDR